MNTSLAMFGIYVEETPSEVSADPSCSRDSIHEDGDWVIVKKQRITVLIPPPSSDATDRFKLGSKQSSLTRTKRDWDAVRKKHPKQMTAENSQDRAPENGSTEKAQSKHLDSIVQKDVPKMMGEILPHSVSVPVIKSELTEGAEQAVQGLFHQETGKVASSFGSMDKPGMPVISSPVANKIMRARLLERRVAGFAGLRNWLLDCGLGWFVSILDSENLGMYQLVSLTMNQLKEMGLVAVGPRRKLIHAIDSLSRPSPSLLEMIS